MGVHHAAGLGPELVDGEPRRVIDDHPAGAVLVDRLDEVELRILRHDAVADVVEIHPGARAEETGGQLLRAHFQTEDPHGDLLIHRDVLRDVHGQRRLAHGGARRDDDHLARVETVGHVVEFLVPGRNTRHLPAVLVEQLDGVKGGADVLLDVGKLGAHAVLRDLEDLLLHVVDEGLHVALFLVASDRRGGADRDHLPEEVFFPDDVDVVVGVGGRWQEGLQLSENRGAPDLLEQIPVGNRLGERDQVDRVAGLREFLNDRENRAVGRMMEMIRIDPLLIGLDQGLPGGEQDRGEDSLLRVEAGREGAMRLGKPLSSGETGVTARGTSPRGLASRCFGGC